MNYPKETTISSINTIIEDTDVELEETIELIRTFSTLSYNREKEPFINTIRDTDMIEITNTVYELTDEYLKDNILTMIEPKFHQKMEYEIIEYIFENWFNAGFCDEGDDNDTDNDFNDVSKLITNIINDYFELSYEWDDKIPKRVSKHYITPIDVKNIQMQIKNIQGIPQPEQRTTEWYKFRHNLITASSLGKIFGSESLRNSLIYEKCSPLKKEDTGYTYVNTLSPLHWGQKYEPVSIMLYEKMFNTKIEDFGCIQHKDHSFIGASPDGINIDNTSDRFGRMLEIKNIVNREIDGNPLNLYWVQMQIQLETCDLEYCDFLETRIKEYENEEEFYKENTDKQRGVILHFVERVSIGVSDSNSPSGETTGYQLAQQYSGVPHYVYMPLNISLEKEAIEEWIEETRTQKRRSWSLYSTIYWHLDELSCVLVERNRQWFKSSIPEIENTWNTIVDERETGYEHRAAKKRIIKPPTLEIVHTNDTDCRIIKNLPIISGICLVKLENEDKNDDNTDNLE
jgi:putative phage-type endonuclease